MKSLWGGSGRAGRGEQTGESSRGSMDIRRVQSVSAWKHHPGGLVCWLSGRILTALAQLSDPMMEGKSLHVSCTCTTQIQQLKSS